MQRSTSESFSSDSETLYTTVYPIPRLGRVTSWACIDLAIWSFIRWYYYYYWGGGGEDKNVLDVTVNMTTL